MNASSESLSLEVSSEPPFELSSGTLGEGGIERRCFDEGRSMIILCTLMNLRALKSESWWIIYESCSPLTSFIRVKS